MIIYNFCQTLFSFWMFAESWAFFVTGDYSWHCEPVDYSDNKDALRVLSLGWWYFFSKFIDLLDTVFFIMRKKYNQVSTLHVIHHSTLPWLSWWGPRFVGGGQAGVGPFLNSGQKCPELLLISIWGVKHFPKMYFEQVSTPSCIFTTCVRLSGLEFRNISGGRNTSQPSSSSSLFWSSSTPSSQFSSHASSLKRPR